MQIAQWLSGSTVLTPRITVLVLVEILKPVCLKMCCAMFRGGWIAIAL